MTNQELNRQLAREVMGWRTARELADAPGAKVARLSDSWLSHGKGFHKDAWVPTGFTDLGGMSDYWNPADDLNHAWMVVEDMKRRGHTLVLDDDPVEGIFVTFAIGMANCVGGVTVGEAICRSALLAFGAADGD